jgi:hypothetical protein
MLKLKLISSRTPCLTPLQERAIWIRPSRHASAPRHHRGRHSHNPCFLTPNPLSPRCIPLTRTLNLTLTLNPSPNPNTNPDGPPEAKQMSPECMERLQFRKKRFGARAFPLFNKYSWVLGLGSWVLGLGSWVLGLGSWVLGLGYWVLVLDLALILILDLGLGSWVLGLGS